MTDTESTRPTPAVDRTGAASDNGQAAAPVIRRIEDWQHRVWAFLAEGALLAALVGLTLAILAGGIGAWRVLKAPAIYSSTTTMLIDDPYQLATAGDENQLLKLQDLRYKYAALTSTEAIAGPVAQATGLPVGAVEGAIAASPAGQALLISVVGKWSDAAEAQRLSAATATALSTYVQEEEITYGVPQVNRFFIRTIGPTGAAVATRPSSGRAAAHGVGYAVAGFAVGYLLTQVVRRARRRLVGSTAS